MIRFITEDKSTSPFVKLFNRAYSTNEDVLYCAESNTLLKSEIMRRAEDGYLIVAYLDLVPDNSETARIYGELLDLYVSGVNLVVIPIVCAEYLFILSVQGIDKAIASQDGLSIILNKSLKYKSLIGGHPEAISRSFEKYCKSFCSRRLNKECCSVESNKHGLAQPYFSCDCGSFVKDDGSSHTRCVECKVRLTLAEKGTRFCSLYPVRPYLGGDSAVSLSFDEIVEISSCLADEYNEWCLREGYPGSSIVPWRDAKVTL